MDSSGDMFQLQSVPVSCDVAVTFFSSIVGLTPNGSFWIAPLLHAVTENRLLNKDVIMLCVYMLRNVLLKYGSGNMMLRLLRSYCPIIPGTVCNLRGTRIL